MTDITDLILKKYYGFGADPNTEKFLSSYEAAYVRGRFDEKSDTPEPTETETIAETADQGPSVDTEQDEVINSIKGDSIGNDIVRSSRAILDNDVLQEEEGSDTSVYDALLASNASNAKRSSTPKIEKIDEPKEFIKNDSIQLEHCEDVFSEKASDESSISKKKKKPRKKSALTNVSTVSSLLPQPPKKLPACNGVFLDLTNLSLTEFPINMLMDMPNLRMLYLENNSLTALPKQLFSSLRLLQWLDVRNNKLTTLPKTVKNHPCLETILLDGNLFEELPLELCLLPNLKELHTLRNPLTFPPNDILALGFAATINVLRAEWNKLHPDEIVESPDRDRKVKPSTILCSDPPILRMISKSSRISGSSSTGRVTNRMSQQISVREKSRNYRPSNRCKNQGVDEELEIRLLWIAKVKDMLTKQSIALQKIKDRNALNDWRQDRRSYEKSIHKAESRTEEDIPFGIDLEDMGLPFKNRSKKPLELGHHNSKNRGPDPLININNTMMRLYESLNKLQQVRQAESLSSRTEQKLLENEIKKLTEVQDEIQILRRYNKTSTTPFEGSQLLPETSPYEPPPSIII